MQDRFKFRVWNKEQQKLYFWEDLEKSKGDNSFYWCMLQAQNDEKNNILMQCTGLKDKNDKLIYEGDIIYSPIWWWGACFVYLNIGECGPCNGDSVMSYILAKNIDNPLKGAVYNIWNGAEVEVIGNIYENKELLNEI